MGTLHSQTQSTLRSINRAAARLLVVEDNEASRRLVTELFRAAGFTTGLTVVRNAEDAIRGMAQQTPDLLLVDWGLPGMSGLDLTRLVRQSAVQPDPRFANPQLPIVMLTGRQRVQDVDLARNAGIDELPLPFSTTLLKAISTSLTRQRPFIVSPGFVGPDRRRARKGEPYKGLLRRSDDSRGCYRRRQTEDVPRIPVGRDGQPAR